MVFIECLGAITGVVGIWLTMRQHIWCFPVGLLSVSISCYVFFNSKLYADALQQVAFASLLILGWFRWSAISVQQHQVKTLGSLSRLSYSVAALALGWALGYVLDEHTDAHYPYVDSILTSFCFLAQFLIAQRKIENWVIWMVTNSGYVVLYIYKDLNVYAGLYAIYFLMAIWGYRQWKSLM